MAKPLSIGSKVKIKTSSAGPSFRGRIGTIVDSNSIWSVVDLDSKFNKKPSGQTITVETKDLVKMQANSSKALGNRKSSYNPSIISQVRKEASELASYIKGRKKKISNTNSFEKARELSEKWHGRDSKEIIDVREIETYHKNLALLADLEELTILQDDDDNSIIPIAFSRNNEQDTIRVCGTPKANQIEFIGGDQSLNGLEKLGIPQNTLNKDLINVGPVYSITYFADKHHLLGPKIQAKGTLFEHEFGEEKDGVLPDLFYDKVNCKLLLVGGSYTIEETGIRN